MQLQADGIQIPLVEPSIIYAEAHGQLAKHLKISPSDIHDIHVERRALDARNKPTYILAVRFTVADGLGLRLIKQGLAKACAIPLPPTLRITQRPSGPPPVIVGAGPGGLMAALTLCEAGLAPIVIERGQPVEIRARQVSRLYARGELDLESNVCFGEGGAGTFSDGKLYTRIGDPRIDRVLAHLVDLGAPEDILVNARPHVGTDKLVKLLIKLRQRILNAGGQVMFGCRMESVKQSFSHPIVRTNLGDIDASHVIVATGHSARGVWHQLEAAGAKLEARPFSVGFRIEHPQTMINAARYRKHADNPLLPAADYRLAHNTADGRGVYSFCMCPGGVVVTTPTEQGALCINGMSYSNRSGRFANSAMVVTVGPQDFGDALYGGVDFQERAERAAYELGGGAFTAPASYVDDFLEGRASQHMGDTSYRRGLTAAPLHALYPEPVISALQEALRTFATRMPGFASHEAKLIGVETRTASPIRVLRNAQCEMEGLPGWYACGEGMGYGGGIVSAAVDGIRCAECIVQNITHDTIPAPGLGSYAPQ